MVTLLQNIFQIIFHNNSYDLIIAGRESIDYNGGMVPGMISAFTNINFIDKCIDLNISDDSV